MNSSRPAIVIPEPASLSLSIASGWYFPLPRIILPLLVCLLAALPAPGKAAEETGLPRAEARALSLSPERLDLLTVMLRQHVNDGRVPGLVAAVARQGKVVYLESLGWQNPLEGTAMRPDSIFQIRSMSKPVTAVAVLQLMERGSLALEDELARYIPEFAGVEVFRDASAPEEGTRAPARAITLEDLLLNTAGLSHRNSALYSERGVRSRSDTLEELAEKVAGVPLVADPGTRWVYSIASTLLGRVVEIVSGQRFDEYLEEHVFRPLEMVDTAFYVPDDSQDRLAQVYEIRPGGVLRQAEPMPVPITEEPPLLEGAAGLVSTVPDYLRFLQMLLNEGELDGRRVLQPETVRRMTENQLPDELLPIAFSPRAPMHALGWGYNLSVVIEPERSAYGVNEGEFGWNGSLGTFSWADPQTETIAVLMMQIIPSGAHSLSEKFKALVYQSVLDP